MREREGKGVGLLFRATILWLHRQISKGSLSLRARERVIRAATLLGWWLATAKPRTDGACERGWNPTPLGGSLRDASFPSPSFSSQA